MTNYELKMGEFWLQLELINRFEIQKFIFVICHSLFVIFRSNRYSPKAKPNPTNHA